MKKHLSSSINRTRSNELILSPYLPIQSPTKMENTDSRRRVLLVTYGAQGHINPALQFAKRLMRHGVHVTYAIALSTYRRMAQPPTTLPHLSFAPFSDGYDAGFKPGDDVNHYMSEIERRGSQAVKDMIIASAAEGRAFTCVVYSVLIPWVAAVARSLHVPSVLLWIQPAAVFDLYYYYYNGYREAIRSIFVDPSATIQLPGLPLLAARDLPSFFRSSSAIDDRALRIYQKHFESLEEETDPKVLVNTFDDLEHDALRAIGKFHLLPIGPLVPSAFLDGKDPSDASFGGDIFRCSSSKDHYVDWLNSKPKASVVYVSFGTLSNFSKQQKEEIARGLLSSGRPFLWVMQEIAHGVTKEGEAANEEDALSCREELEAQGKIVSWCSQLEVLSSPATGCFLTHCGWNSSLESLVCSVPVVAFPLWTDQGTNAMIIRDLSETGVRLELADDGVVDREEIKRCLELVMGDSHKGEEIRRNAVKWKKLAREAAADGGPSDANFKAFVDQVCHIK